MCNTASVLSQPMGKTEFPSTAKNRTNSVSKVKKRQSNSDATSMTLHQSLVDVVPTLDAHWLKMIFFVDDFVIFCLI